MDITTRDPLFKGCTRPAMLWGVPIVPLVLVGSFFVLMGIYVNILVTVTLIPVFFIMRQIAKKDDQQFRLLGLRILFRIVHLNRNGAFWKASTYAPVAFVRRKGRG